MAASVVLGGRSGVRAEPGGDDQKPDRPVPQRLADDAGEYRGVATVKRPRRLSPRIVAMVRGRRSGGDRGSGVKEGPGSELRRIGSSPRSNGVDSNKSACWDEQILRAADHRVAWEAYNRSSESEYVPQHERGFVVLLSGWKSAAARVCMGVLMVMSFTTACTHSEPESSISAASANSSFWPATDRPIALIVRGDSLAITDADSVLPIDVRIRSAIGPYAARVARNGDVLAGVVDGKLFAISLRNGAASWRACAHCGGLAGYGEGFVTALDDGTVLVLDQNLQERDTIDVGPSIWEQPPPGSSGRYADWRANYSVADTGDKGTVTLISVPPWAFPRSGPSLLSIVNHNGGISSAVEVSGLSGEARPGTAVGRYAVSGLSEGGPGPCDGDTSLSILGEGEQPVNLLEYVAPSDGSYREYSQMLTDWSWNGDDLIAVGYHSASTEGNWSYYGCRIGEWDVIPLDPESPTMDDDGANALVNPALEQFRVLDDCQNSLALQSGDEGRSAALIGVRDGLLRKLGEAQKIIWSAPPVTGCSDLASALGYFS